MGFEHHRCESASQFNEMEMIMNNSLKPMNLRRPLHTPTMAPTLVPVPTIARAIAAAILVAALATPALAGERVMAPEEKKGSVVGGIIGAVAGGPVGAGFGAIIGGGIFGQMAATHRRSEELSAALVDADEAHRQREVEMGMLVAGLNRDLNQMVRLESVAFKDPQISVQFRTASFEVEAHYEAALKRVARVLERNQDATIDLAGYADPRGSEQYNEQLSLARLTRVKDLLIDNGARPGQITSTAYGETGAVASDETREGYFFDRRVVLKLDLNVAPQLATR